MEKINITELLKSCPKGMELDCYLFNGLEFDHIDTDNENYPIVCRAKTLSGEYNIHSFTKYGWFTAFFDYSKCVIYPKGKTSWEGFHRPFKDGDILTADNVIFIYNGFENDLNYGTYALIDCYGVFTVNFPIKKYNTRFATEEEKAKLFDAIKGDGYKWNPETKTLENLIEPKFKVGDRVRPKNTPSFIVTINDIDESSYYYGNSNSFWILDQNKWELVPMMTPKFKIGDRIKNIRTGQIHKVTDIYGCNEHISFQVDYSGYEISCKFQDEYELVPNKFDIDSLVPFESKVLIRNDESQYWIPAFWGCKRFDGYTTTFGWCKYCIPYEGNEHLLETTNDCNEYYKTWK